MRVYVRMSTLCSIVHLYVCVCVCMFVCGVFGGFVYMCACVHGCMQACV